MTSVGSSIEDAVLLRTYAARGDAAAFAELVRRYADFVYATARRVTGSNAVAEDVAQDCFLSLAMHSGGIRGSVAAWLHRTTLNRSLELLRSERARKQRELVAAEVAAAAATTAAAAAASAASNSAQLIAHVDEAIAALSDELRIAVTEHFLCGRSQVELAAAMGVNQSTVSRRIDAGLKELRQRLAARGVSGVGLVAFPLLLSDVLREDAAAAVASGTVRAALTKIGLAGVRTTSSAASGMSALTKAAAALLLLLASAGGIIALAFSQSPPTRPTRQVVVPAGVTATTSASSRERDAEDDDDDEKEDHQDDNRDL